MLSEYDALIVGGGAAGLSAALVLGRARRDVLVIDDGLPRNAAAEFSHGFLTRDGARPAELIRCARADIAAYPSVRFITASVAKAIKVDQQFRLIDKVGRTFLGKRLLIATGVFDKLPEVAGLPERWGKSVFVCPFCDGWEVQDQLIAVYGKGRDAVELAQELRGWTTRIVICPEQDDLTPQDRRWLKATHSALKVGKLRAIADPGNTLCFDDDAEIVCDALFLSAPLRQHSPLFAELGCKIDKDGLVVVDKHSNTTVAGCYAAGDAVTVRHQVIIAAASGAAAAITLNCNLLEAEAHALTRRKKHPRER